ncbi:ubiquitin-like protein FUBI [Gigantopelta aegis]|uniref:ubiquitin-like protein FUBI n=1 Tax=Gigantopelta aegis TaxID=1735272 RepID=UPI001B88A4F0|nr:ubiquitin-like protein FUBI [Gigantopelta aegis]XP_041354376.1 ubiquitin-like protein FUBI [Gigantopelta aegis]
MMQLFVRATQTHTLDVTGAETVQHVKAYVSEKEGFDSDDILVLSGGHPLENDVLLSTLENLSTLDIEIPLLGGKVHGSLARAGKVRGQTPKVEKQEKKKAKTGRAKRRMQYNRRFVNVVATFGRRRGPNART